MPGNWCQSSYNWQVPRGQGRPGDEDAFNPEDGEDPGEVNDTAL